MCAKLITAYDDALAQAKMCDAGAKGAPCTKSVPAQLSGCQAACTTFVNDDSKPKMLQQQWTKLGCVPEGCPVTVCINPAKASCTVGGGDKGTCTDSPSAI